MSDPLMFKCPDCGSIGRIDDEQASGQVSIICSECRWHGYVDNVKADMFGRRKDETDET